MHRPAPAPQLLNANPECSRAGAGRAHRKDASWSQECGARGRHWEEKPEPRSTEERGEVWVPWLRAGLLHGECVIRSTGNSVISS